MGAQGEHNLAPEGRKILSILLLITSGFFLLGIFIGLPIFQILGGISSFILVFCLNFFRDPERVIPYEKNIIIAPADGQVTNIQIIDDPDVGEKSIMVTIFLSVFNVHINRVPLNGKVISTDRKKGQFIAAYRHNADDVNEQITTVLFTEIGNVKVKQIAGILARRIHCYAEKDKDMRLGDRLGFIMFGSRTDVILPTAVSTKIEVGERIKGNETIIGTYS